MGNVLSLYGKYSDVLFLDHGIYIYAAVRCMLYGKDFSVISYWFKLFRQEIRKKVRDIIPTNIMDIIRRRPKDSTKCVDIMDIRQL